MTQAQIPPPPSPNKPPASMPSAPLSTSSTIAATPDTQPLDLAAVDRIISEIGRERRCALPLLQAVQAQYHYLPLPALIRICETTEISPAQIEGVATFYSQFRRMPVGRHLVSVCHGTACHVAGAEKVTEAVRRHLRLEGEADTDSGKLFTVQKVACLGCCSLAPVVRIDDRVYGHVAGETAGSVLEKFLRQEEDRAREKAAPERRRPRRRRGAEEPVEIRIGLGSCCMASGSAEVKERLDATLRAMGEDVVVKCGACIGMCHRVPLVEFVRPGRQARYGGVKPSAVRNILAEQLRPAGILRQARSALRRAGDLLTTESSWQPARSYSLDPESGPVRAFLAKQKEIVLEGRGEMDPLDIEEYRAHGGYAALKKGLRELSPDAVIQIVKDSGLRPRRRGLSGRRQVGRRPPPGRAEKVHHHERRRGRSRRVHGPHDARSRIRTASSRASPSPHTPSARAMRSSTSAPSTRSPSAARARPSARPPNAAISGPERRACPPKPWRRRAAFNVNLHVMEGAGAFVCGEETGLIASLEGRRGMPRFRPPYPAESGLWGMPTSVNNVETFANVPWIIRHGAEAYAAVGTATSKGTKVFALAGKVVRGGLIEVPMGITVGEIVEEIGGGMKGRAQVQGGADRRPVRRLHPRVAARYAHRLRGADQARRDDGLRRAGRDGRHRVHGGHRALLPAIHPERVLRQMHLLPHRHEADARNPRPHVRGRRGRGRPRAARRARRASGAARSLCGLGQTAPNPVPHHAANISATSTRRTSTRSAAPPSAAVRSSATRSPTAASVFRVCTQQWPFDAIEPRSSSNTR